VDATWFNHRVEQTWAGLCQAHGQVGLTAENVMNNRVKSRVGPEGGFKNRNWKPDLLKHNSGSCYWNRNIFFDIPVPVNPDPDIQILDSVLA
jgi:hypothetical protein